jgi:hypothetical protein
LGVLGAITVVGALIGLWIVPSGAGGNPTVQRFCVPSCQHAFPSWLWPVIAIAFLSLIWLLALRRLIVRPLQAQALLDEGRSDGRSGVPRRVKATLAEGWFHDPYDLHEARWYSVGAPTSLVRDGALVGQDPAPEEPCTCPLVPVEDAGDPSDLRRADDGGFGRSLKEAAADSVCTFHMRA